jgi:nucleoid-associated protein YgaU
MTTIVVILALAIYGLGTDPGTPGSDEPVSSSLVLERNEPSNIQNPGEGRAFRPENTAGTLVQPNPTAPPFGLGNPAPDTTQGVSGPTMDILKMPESEVAAPPSVVVRDTDRPREPVKQPAPTRRTWASLSESPIEGFKVYTVEKGDTLTSITREFYGEERLWRNLLSYNADLTPDRLRTRTPVLMPHPDQIKAAGSRSTQPEVGTGRYRVLKGDTLFSIARRELQDASQWRKVLELNRGILSGPQDLKPDMVLTLR